MPDGHPRSPLAEALELQPHPEGGWYRETWRSEVTVRPPDYDGERATATCIYFLLAPGEESRWHVVKSDEIWLWHAGGPLEISLGGTGEAPDPNPTSVTLGRRFSAGEAPQFVVPAGTWQSARPSADNEVLVSCVVSPGFDFADFRLL